MADLPINEKFHKQNVREIQGYLRSLYYGGHEIPLVIPDGIYGEETTAAVKAFQALVGIEPTGKTDMDTWERLVMASSDVEGNLREQEGIMPLTLPHNTQSAEMNGASTALLQLMLWYLASIYSNLTPVEVNGVYDKVTTDAVKIMQNVFGIEPTGNGDIRTWNYIVRTFNAHI